jgi:hypothetical protein
MNQIQQYRAQALAAEAAAEGTTLDNVRERNLRSAKAWHAMADRAEHVERMKAVPRPNAQS